MFAGLAMALGSAALSYEGGKERNASQTDASNAQMAFQADMSNTSYRRAVNDLQAAGLNPMLAYSQGGASTPAGSQPNIEDVITPAISTASGVFRANNDASVARAQVDNINTDTGLKSSQTAKNQADTELSRTQAALNLVQAERERSQIGVNSAQEAFTRTNQEFVAESIKKVAPEIKKMFSEIGVNNATKQKLLSELPLIVSQIRRNNTESDESFSRRLLNSIELNLKGLKQNEAQVYSDMYGSQYGKSLPYVNSASQAFGNVSGAVSPWAWLFRSK